MPLDGEYVPSSQQWVRDQVELIESSGGTDGTLMRGMPVVVVASRGAKSGKVRKNPVMKVEHEGSYAVVASKGGAPEHPTWYYNMRDDPHVVLQDGPLVRDMVAHVAHGEERETWWERAVAAYPDYADYAAKTDREIPVFVVDPADPPQA